MNALKGMKKFSRILGTCLIILGIITAITSINESDFSLDNFSVVIVLILIGFFLLKIFNLKKTSRILGIGVIIIAILAFADFIIEDELSINYILLLLGLIIVGALIFIDYKDDKKNIEESNTNRFNHAKTDIENNIRKDYEDIKSVEEMKHEEELKSEEEKRLKKLRKAELHILIAITFLYFLTLLLFFIMFIYLIATMKMNEPAYIALLLFATLQILFTYIGYFSKIRFFYLLTAISFAVPIPIIYVYPDILWEFSKIYMVIYFFYAFVFTTLFFGGRLKKFRENFLKF